jgi:steroid delta-isomerase-like uncharacterized protein
MIIDGKRASDVAIAAVLAYYAAFNKRDWKGVLATLKDDVVHDVNQGRREEGRAKFGTFLECAGVHYKEQVRDLIVMSCPDGKRASAEFVVHGEYLETDEGLPPARGQKYVLPAGAFFELAKGRIARVTTYYNLQDWIRQVTAA